MPKFQKVGGEIKCYPKELKKATRDALVGSVVGFIGLCLAVLLIYILFWIVGYNYNVEKYIPQMTVVAVIITAVGTTANSYRERKLKRQEKIKEIITEKRSVWLGKTREAIAELYAA